MSSDPFDDKDPRTPPRLGLYGGVVTDRADPQRLGRVRVRVPGVFEPFGPWVRPLTLGGGGLNGGFFAVPQLGADVGIFFLGGNVEEPYYMSLGYGTGEVPEEAFDEDGPQEPDNVVWSFPGFRMEVSGREDKRKLRFTNQKTGDTITMDQESNEILISATTRLVLKAEGEIELDASQITIAGRPVALGSIDPI